MDPVVEPALTREAAQIHVLQCLCYLTEAELYDDYAIPPLTQTLESLLGEYGTHQVLATRLDDEVVGSVRGRLVDATYHVGRLVVHPRLRRRGLGTRLMRHRGALRRGRTLRALYRAPQRGKSTALPQARLHRVSEGDRLAAPTIGLPGEVPGGLLIPAQRDLGPD